MAFFNTVSEKTWVWFSEWDAFFTETWRMCRKKCQKLEHRQGEYFSNSASCLGLSSSQHAAALLHCLDLFYAGGWYPVFDVLLFFGCWGRSRGEKNKPGLQSRHETEREEDVKCWGGDGEEILVYKSFARRVLPGNVCQRDHRLLYAVLMLKTRWADRFLFYTYILSMLKCRCLWVKMTMLFWTATTTPLPVSGPIIELVPS